ncbi:MAG: hypothetical protein JNM00_07610, partial [Flavobacteriales bacterium]|nr:hypothetical protein [Flavobacteriales bacterium]
MKKTIAFLTLVLSTFMLFSQQMPGKGGLHQSPQWTNVTNEPQRDVRWIVPANYRTVGVDLHTLQAHLMGAPHESVVRAAESTYIIELPAPDGTMQQFTLVESPIMEQGLQDQFPEIRTFAGQGIDDRAATLRCDITPRGFHAQVLTPKGAWYIDPYSPADTEIYISYSRQSFYANTDKVRNELAPVMPDDIDMDKFDEIMLDPPGKKPKKPVNMMGMQKTTNGTNLRTYRLALAGTGEYTAFHGGTVALGLAAMVTSMNRVNGVYERDMSIRMNMVANNNLLVYTNAATDPYTNSNGATMLGENQTNCNAVIGSANYDIGHVFSTGGGGIAALNSPCTANKAQGVTGQPSPVGDPFDIDYVAHEMGHQFGGNHTQNNSCNRAASAAYEPGSASTIMGYAGICAPNLQLNSDDYFHVKSFNEMYTFSVTGTGNTCAALSATGNTPPTVTLPTGGLTIPISTPFELTATGSDANGDLITYCWEEYDLGPATAAGDNNLTNPSGNQPIFRSWDPTTNATRVFPRISDLVNNTTVIGELLPTYDRTLTFKCTVRDNRAGGGGVTDSPNLVFTVDNIGGPFVVTAPNTAVTWVGNSTQTVTWNVANTTAAPISAANVDIWLSTDGGFTYPILVLAGTPNDGTQTITVPNNPTTQARIKVKASNNIFFDISNVNFTITAGGGGFAYDLLMGSIASPTGTYCGDSFTPQFNVTNLGTTNITSFTAQYNIDGGANQNYNWSGSLATGASTTVTLPGMTAATGAHTFNVTLINPNGNADQNASNNTGSSSFNTVTGGNLVTLTLLTDCWGEEVSWNIENASNVVLYSQAVNTLGDQTTFTNNFCLSDGCYDFNISDSFGDGLDGTASGCAIDGNYTITDASANVLVQMGNANYGTGITHNFCLPYVPGAIPGCMDVTACNYNAAATVDDGSCTYGPANDVCENATLLTVNAAALSTTNVGACVNGTTPSCGGTQQIQDVWYKFVYTGGNISIATALGTNTDTRLAVWTSCGGSQIACDDDNGPGNASLISLSCGTITPGNTYYIQAGGFQQLEGTFTIQVTMTDISGCTNPLASNYNSCATLNDGSCVIPGCTDPAACNYNAAATTNNGTCTYPGCQDPAACNYNAAAGCAATCNYPVACNDPAACNYTAGACMNGTCNYPVACNDPAACNYTAGACMNGTCNYPVACNDPVACNY